MSAGLSIFYGVIALFALFRVMEMGLSSRNERKLLAGGGREIEPWHFSLMKVMHLCWFVAMLIEAPLLGSPVPATVMVAGILLLILTNLVRLKSMADLGPHWTAKVLVTPGMRLVRHGLYRYLRHPNYMAVVVEIAVLPLLYGCYMTAAVFTILNACMLMLRIRIENQALEEWGEKV